MLASTGAVDFDDLVVGAADALESDPRLRLRWQDRFTHLCVDEFQDVDAAQLRLVRLLAEPQRNLFVVGDDDQTIYAWRLADVRRILSFEALYPGTRRVQLATNYRCPAPVVAISRRLIGVNRERFVKRIDPSPTAGSRSGHHPGLPHHGRRMARWLGRPGRRRGRGAAHGLLPGANAIGAGTDAAGARPRRRPAHDHGAGRGPGRVGPAAGHRGARAARASRAVRGAAWPARGPRLAPRRCQRHALGRRPRRARRAAGLGGGDRAA